MTYAAVNEMRMSPSLIGRAAACAAQEDVPDDPQYWVQEHLWALVKDPVWADVWCEAKGAPDVGNMNPDTGARTDVITDTMIRVAVYAILHPEAPEIPAPEEPKKADDADAELVVVEPTEPVVEEPAT